MTVEEMLDRMSAREFAGWVAMDHIAPIGDTGGEDMRRAVGLANFVNANRKKGAAPVRHEKFMLRPPLPKMSTADPEQLKHQLMMLVPPDQRPSGYEEEEEN